MTSSEAMAVGGDGGLSLFDLLALANELKRLPKMPKVSDEAGLRAWLKLVAPIATKYTAKTATGADDALAAAFAAMLNDDAQWAQFYALVSKKTAFSAAEVDAALGAKGKWAELLEKLLPIIIQILPLFLDPAPEPAN